MKRMSVSLALFSFLAVSAQASILPKNNFHIFDDPSRLANMTEQEFESIVNQAIAIWEPLAKAQGANLKGEKKWKDSTVNAYASQNGKSWTVSMFGGLARRPEVTKDGFMLVVCHELGHHFGGFAFYEGNDWAASEGQSDYFATQACAHAVWENETAENAKFRTTVGAFEKQKCDSVWSEEKDQNLCYRSAAAGKSLATLLAALGGDPAPHFDTPDTKVVKKTYTAHPDAQCRLDTYFGGALCTKEANLKVIPGKAHPKGQESVEAEREAYQTSCSTADGYQTGVRPLCWFKPQI